MNSIHIWGGTASIVLLMTLSAHAGPTEETALSLEDAYRLALRKNDEVRAADAALYQARLWPKRAYTLLTPKFSLMGTYTYQREISYTPLGIQSLSFLVQPPQERLYQATMLWTLYQGTIAAYWRQAHRLAEGAEAANIQMKQDILFQVATAYYGLLRVQKLLTIAQEAVAQADGHLRQAQALRRVGQATRVAVLRARMERAQAQKLLVDGENGLTIARESLSLLIGMEGEYRVGEAEEPVPPLEADRLISQALKEREDLKKAGKDEEFSLEDWRVMRGRFLPTLSVAGNYSYSQPVGTFATPWNWRVTLNLTLPLFQGGSEYLDLMDRNAALEQAKARREALRKQISLEVRKAVLDVESAAKNLDSLKLGRDLARETSALVEAQFTVGAATSIELTDAHAALVTAEQRLADGTYALNLAVLSLQKATGTFARDIVASHE